MRAFTFILIVLAIILLMSFTVVGSATFVPYSKSTLFSNMYPYEGFGNPTEYSTFPENASLDFQKNHDIESNDSPCRKVMGFNGLFCSATNEPANPLDTFSKASGSMTCPSYGYMNSRGFLCLDAEQKRLLSSRGGNASGVV
jgi:hypothetical protein